MNLIHSPQISVKELTTLLGASDDQKQHLIVLDASIPPIGTMATPENSWPYALTENARRFDINNEFSQSKAAFPHTMLGVEEFQSHAQALGINQNSSIVVYDHFGLFSAARAWWMFKAMGHNAVSILDGGLPQWLNHGYQLTHSIPQQSALGNFVAKNQANYFVNTELVSQHLEDAEYCVIDARSAARFYGKEEEPRSGVRRGHMPNAKNLPYSELLINGQFKSVAVMKELFEQRIGNATKLTMTCGSGVTACILAAAASMCGYQHISVYDGSWSEWGSNNKLPVA